MKLGWAKRCSCMMGVVSVATLILAIVVTSSISSEQDADAQEDNRNDGQKEDGGFKGSLQESKEQVMTICLMPLDCS